MRILATKQSTLTQILETIASKRSKNADVSAVVQPILDDVKVRGDEALKDYSQRFDGVALDTFAITSSDIEEAYTLIEPSLIDFLKRAKAAIETFHISNIQNVEAAVETAPGVKVWREFRPIEKVGLYVPGGTATYPSTVLMTAVPAKIAGCSEIIICTPCDSSGKCNAAVLVAADLCGINKIFKVGGAQAIAAMAYGTKTIPKVYKIFGPGNQYVSTAKMMVFGEVDIDKPAGPSEVEVIADDQANPRWVAADLLSQLEHGGDSQAVLVSFSNDFAEVVIQEMQRQMKGLTRRGIIEESFNRSFAVVVQTIEEACQLTNEYAPEHVEIMVDGQEEAIMKRINNAGSVFLGAYASEPLGDYATGANHTLPTSGYAKMFPPLSTESFGKMMQIQAISRQGILSLKETVECIAISEGFDAHARAVSIRFES